MEAGLNVLLGLVVLVGGIFTEIAIAPAVVQVLGGVCPDDAMQPDGGFGMKKVFMVRHFPTICILLKICGWHLLIAGVTNWRNLGLGNIIMIMGLLMLRQ